MSSIDPEDFDQFEDFEPVMDDMFEFDSAMGSAGWGTDEWYRPEMDHLEDSW